MDYVIFVHIFCSPPQIKQQYLAEVSPGTLSVWWKTSKSRNFDTDFWWINESLLFVVILYHYMGVMNKKKRLQQPTFRFATQAVRTRSLTTTPC